MSSIKILHPLSVIVKHACLMRCRAHPPRRLTVLLDSPWDQSQQCVSYLCREESLLQEPVILKLNDLRLLAFY